MCAEFFDLRPHVKRKMKSISVSLYELSEE